MASTLSNALEFFRDFGFFDVLLPFLLVFTVVFAVLQKTEILGKDKANLDAMVAFVVGLLFVAATKAVAVINEALPQVMVLVIAALGFLMMIGIFAQPGGTFLDNLGDKTKLIMEVIMGVSVIFIFLGTLRLNNGQSWLSYGWNYMINYWSGAVVGSMAMFIFVIIVIYFVVGGSENKDGDK